MQYLAHVHRSLSVGTLPIHQIRWDWGFIIICVKICKSLFFEDKCVLVLPILDPYSSHMTLPMWVQHGTLLQIPHESLMDCPYRTHINTHLGPMWVLYFLLAGNCWHFSYLLAENFSCPAMFSKKEFEIVSNLKFISRANFMLG